MKLLIVLIGALALASATREIRPIEEYILKHPEKYTAWHELSKRSPLDTDELRPSRGGRIVGGDEAIPGQYPYQVAIFIYVEEGAYFCGGSLVKENVVLTAAHCVDA